MCMTCEQQPAVSCGSSVQCSHSQPAFCEYCRYDATSHFETTVEDVMEMYTRITGKVLDLSTKDPSKAAQ